MEPSIAPSIWALIVVARHMIEAMVAMLKRGEEWHEQEDTRPQAGPGAPEAQAA
jgi:hypothetical protein